MKKPHIWFSRSIGLWLCSDDRDIGQGKSWLMAYISWRVLRRPNHL
jgi:hypothetical protein